MTSDIWLGILTYRSSFWIAYALQKGRWSHASKLPAPLGYGAAFQLDSGVLIVGGELQGSAASKEVMLLEFDGNAARVSLSWLIDAAGRRSFLSKERNLSSKMFEEASASALAVARQNEEAAGAIARLAHSLAAARPRIALTVGRGSSDHAANYLAYLLMRKIGIPTVSLPLSLLTLHDSQLQVDGQPAFAISQSGGSPDLVTAMKKLRAAGARTVALVNAGGSPLAAACEVEISLCAGAEYSVAATKSYLASLSASARLVAGWSGDTALLAALQDLPGQLEQASRHDWSPALAVLAGARRVMVAGRGLGLAIALEAALKLKETCAIQAEAFSGAEIRHGPMALIDDGYPLLIFAPRGPEQAGMLALADDMRKRGANVLLAAPADIAARQLTISTASDPALDPLLAIQSFYLMAARLAGVRGMDPDRPRHLTKVTRTV